MKPDHRALIAQSALVCCSLLAGYICGGSWLSRFYLRIVL